MLASTIQSGMNSRSGNLTASELAPAPAEATSVENATSNTLSMEKTSASDTHFSGEANSELFSEQLSDVLINADQSEITGEQPVAQIQESQPRAEEWLLTMLDQQQLQLQARDTLAPTTLAQMDATATAQLSADAAELTNASPQMSPVVIEKFAGEKHSLPFPVYQDSLAENTLAKTVGQPQKNTNSFATVNITPVANTDSNNAAATNTSASTVVSPSTIPVAQLATTTAIADVTNNQLIAPAALNASGDDNVQRSVQSSLGLHAPEAKWGEQLLHALRDNVQVQIQQRMQNATIRLDPPELGSLEIYLSHEAGRLTVHITASQTDVARLIQQTSDRLRQELAGPQFTQVNVQTSAEGQGGQQQSRERQRLLAEDTILANEQSFVNSSQPANRVSDVLVTV